MEESQDLMWMMKRKQNFKSPIETVPYGIGAIYNNNNSNNSWEEKAFAEDAARILGGCIWPPRSYSCHFCKREFRSAQALGGHMNVHRRDRARLKQSVSHHNEEAFHSHHKNHFTTTSRVSSSWPSTICTQENCFQPNMSTYSSSIRKGNHIDFLKGVANEKEHIFKGLSKNDFVETSLSMGQNNAMFGQKLACGDKAIAYKRTKTSSLPCLNERCLSVKSAEFVIGIKPGIEDLDLELRLGKTQKV